MSDPSCPNIIKDCLKYIHKIQPYADRRAISNCKYKERLQEDLNNQSISNKAWGEEEVSVLPAWPFLAE